MNPQKTILVVDDEELVTQFFRETLQRSGYTVETASSAEAALKLLATVEFDVVLTDVKMPGLSGIDLLQQICKESEETPVLMITAHGTVQDAVKAMKLGGV